MRENNWGAVFDRMLGVATNILSQATEAIVWPQATEDLTVAQVLGTLIFLF